MLLLLLGFYLRRRRWLREEIEKDVNDPEVEASDQGAANSRDASTEPWRELVADSRPEMLDAGRLQSPLKRRAQSSFKQDRIEGLRIPHPSHLPRGGISNRMLWRLGARKTVAAATGAMVGFGRQRASTAPVAASEATAEATSTTSTTIPDTGCVARASGSGGSGQASFSADAQCRASRKASIDAEPPSTFPQLSPARKRMSEGKLAGAVEVAPTDKAARFRARKTSITAGDELFEGAKGTKQGPGREFSARRGKTNTATSELAHMAPNIRSALSYDAGSSGSISCSSSSSSSMSSSSDGSGGQTKVSAGEQHVPNSPARTPDETWAAVRARRASVAALNSDRRQRLQAMHKERVHRQSERLSVRERERSPVAEAGGPVRV